MTASDSDEAQLLSRAQAGERDAFQILLRRHLPAIHQYCLRMLGSESDAADMSQEVFIRFWQKMDSFDATQAKLTTWLHQIAHNLCIDSFRKRSRQAKFKNNLKDTSSALSDEQGNTMDEISEQKDLSHTVKAAIGHLPERQRSALLFCHYQGLSNKQAAEILDISVEALESLLSRARRTLKGTLLEANHD